MPLTVSEIAQRLKPDASKAERHALSERIAHWTRERLLAPVGGKIPGLVGLGATRMAPTPT